MPLLLPLSPRTVHVWLAPLDPGAGPEALAACLEELEPWERAECAQLRTPALRQAYAQSHVLVRRALSRVAPVAPGAWRLRRGPLGRPEVAGPEHGALHYSLSHAEGAAACAVASGAAVGVDVEPLARAGQTLALVQQFLSQEELVALAALPPHARAGRSLDLWTLKEAYAKGQGLGLHLPFERVSFAPPRGEAPPQLARDATTADPPGAWHFRLHLAPGGGHRVALAVRPQAPGLVEVHWHPAPPACGRG